MLLPVLSWGRVRNHPRSGSFCSSTGYPIIRRIDRLQATNRLPAPAFGLKPPLQKLIRNALRRFDDVLDCAGFEIRASEVVRFYLLHRLRVRRRFEYGLTVAVKSTTPPGWAYPLCAKAGSVIQEG